MTDDDLIVCRCEEVTLGVLRRALSEGAATQHELKLCTRAGMGACQGRTCRPLTETLVAQAGRPSLGERPLNYRIPVRPVPLDCLARTERESGSE